jgi:nucleotide-binding universal stress UspA family protein
MIVMGTTAKNKLRGILLGSVSHRVAELSELPVLLIP